MPKITLEVVADLLEKLWVSVASMVSGQTDGTQTTKVTQETASSLNANVTSNGANLATAAKQDSLLTELEKKPNSEDTQEVSDVSTLNQLKEQQEIDETEIGLNVEELILKNMDKKEEMPFYVRLPKDLKQEIDGSLLIADMKGPITWSSWAAANAPIVIDCMGYQSVLVQKITAGVVTPTVSNDGITFVAALAAPVSTAVAAATLPTAANLYVLPVVSRYLKLTGPASTVTCYIYLSQSPYQAVLAVSNQSTNIAQFGGTTVVNAGLAGVQSVGGNVATGVAPTTNPVQIGGVDDLKVPLIRRALVDSAGRCIIATQTGQIPGTTGVVPLNPLGYLSTYKNILAVQELTINEDGENALGVLSQILFEIKILNQQIFELPRLINAGFPSLDEPQQFREETKSIFE